MSRKWKIVLAVLVVLIGLAFTAWLFRGAIERWFFVPTPSTLDEVGDLPEVEVVAEDLDIPWELAFLPDGDILVTERPGTLKRIGQNQQTFGISGVEHVGEGGLLGMALHPEFEDNRWLYLYLTTSSNGGLINRVERYHLNNDQLTDRQTIIDDIPGAAFHDGGRIAFGPGGLLYITTGDAGTPELSQDRNSLAGKLLRLNADGSIPEDNPFGNAVYSYGHRNAQGIAWDEEGRLWSTEHGRSGRLSGLDELNLIQRGLNYGWPRIEGDETHPGMENPVIHSGPDETWAPAGLAYQDGWLFWAGLRGESLYRARVEGDSVRDLSAMYRSEFGRLRAVVVGPAGALYITTSNTDGRGNPKPGDDKIIRLVGTEGL